MSDEEKNDRPTGDWLTDEMVNEHERNERRFTALERRLSKVEKRGSILPNLDEENVFFYLTVAYVLFGFVLPAVIRAFKPDAEI